jgi:hypothetical protein
MSNSTQARGWWQATDGNWYPPESHPDVALRLAPTPPPPRPGYQSYSEHAQPVVGPLNTRTKSRRMYISRLTTPQRISAVSILVVALAAFLPWVSIFVISVRGIEGDGGITLALAIAGGIVLALTTGLFGKQKVPGKKSQISLLVLASLVALIGLLDMNGAAAIGLYLTLFGGVAWVVGAAWQLSISKHNAGQPDRAAV